MALGDRFGRGKGLVGLLLMAFVIVALSVLAGFFWEYGYLERTRAVETSTSDIAQAAQATIGFLIGGLISAFMTLVLARALRRRRHAAGLAALGGNVATFAVGAAFLMSWHDPAPAVLVPLALATLGTLSFWLILSRWSMSGWLWSQAPVRTRWR